jgi:hypothetical protein
VGRCKEFRIRHKLSAIAESGTQSEGPQSEGQATCRPATCRPRGKGGFTQTQVEAEAAKGGGLPLHRVIRLRVRYLSDGAVLGSAAFVEDVFARHRSHFGERRKTGARRMKGADWEDLRVLRDLRIDRTG